MNDQNRTKPRRPPAATIACIERLLLHALRQWVHDRRRWPEVVLEFNRTCGPCASTRLCEALDSAFRTLGLHARRNIRLHPVLCCHVSQDELCLLNIVAAYQAHSWRHAEGMMRWLVSHDAVPILKSDIDKIARGLCEAGYVLDIRRPAARPATPSSRHLHAVHDTRHRHTN